MESPSIVPRPTHVRTGEGRFVLDRPLTVSCGGVDFATADYVRNCLATLGISLEPAADATAAHIVVDRIDKADLGPEGYLLDVQPEQIRIGANGDAGAFYAAQTLRQLLPTPSGKSGPHSPIPCLSIEDQPRFSWRGMHLDVCRHFFSAEYVLGILDWMAVHKLNRFHWHLTEDQGWRLHVPKYPALTEIGAWRRGDRGERYGGYYTEDDVRRVVAHARRLHIEVVPEIEMPGHAQAALAAYPSLSCRGGPFEVWTDWGISDEVYCVGNDEVFRFLESVLETVIDLFPGDYIHLGADECPKRRWKECGKCQSRMSEEGLVDENELQSYFMTRMTGFLASRGRKPIGWDEILEGGLPPQAAVMSWRGTDGGIAAARAGHDVVMTPNSHVYFDYKHYDGEAEPGRLGVTSLEKVYSFEPIPSGLRDEEARHILGSQANVWTEGIEDEAAIERMVFPRLCALAEVLWSPREKDWQDFRRRMKLHGTHLDALGIRYYRDKAVW